MTRSIYQFVLYFILLLICSACESTMIHNSASAASPRDAMLVAHVSHTPNYQIKAKFIAFESGDVDHFLFEDAQGKIWDFPHIANQEDFAFKQPLPKERHNAFNQGWASNELFQDKWFLLDCASQHKALYKGGPQHEVTVVTEATLLY